MAGDAAEPLSSRPPDSTLESPVPLSSRNLPKRLTLVTLEQNLWHVSIAELETSLSEVTPENVRVWFDSDLSILEVGLLRTCQRLLLLALSRGPELVDRLLARMRPYGAWEVRRDGDAIRHLYRISAGLDSRAPGEREIREQVGTAAAGVVSRHPRPVVRDLLLKAVDAAARLEGSGSGSVADLAAEWLRPRLPGSDVEVLVIGGGTVGRRVAERLAGEARVTVLYHRLPPDLGWTGRWGIRARPSEEMGEALRSADVVVAAAKTTRRLLRGVDLPTSPGLGPRWFVDLGVPRNIDPEVGLRPGVELVDLGGLPRAHIPIPRLVQMTRAIDEAAEESVTEFGRAAVEPWISELRRQVERVRQEEWERALARAGPVSDTARLAFERFSDRLVRRLLAGPTTELRSLPPGPETDLRRRQLLEMFEEPYHGP